MSVDPPNRLQECVPCGYPYQSNCRVTFSKQYDVYQASYLLDLDSCDSCSLVCLGADSSVLFGITGTLAALFFGLFFFMYEKDKKFEWLTVIGMMFYCSLPVLDTYTDVIFIFSNEFISMWLLSISIVALILPNLALVHLLKKRNAVWPAIPIATPESLDFGDIDNIAKASFSFVILSPLMFANGCILAFKLIVGMYLFSTKSLCIGNVANWWFKWWTGGDDHEMDEAIDTEILNESVYVEIVCETFPQVLIQLCNNYNLDSNISQWGTVSLFSLSLTLMNAVNGVYQFIYFKFIKDKIVTNNPVTVTLLGYKLVDAPPTNHQLIMEKNIRKRKELAGDVDDLEEEQTGMELIFRDKEGGDAILPIATQNKVTCSNEQLSIIRGELQGLLLDHEVTLTAKLQSLQTTWKGEVQEFVTNILNKKQGKEVVINKDDASSSPSYADVEEHYSEKDDEGGPFYESRH